ncbi:MAG TPA: GNAT family N-acetyltransferase [Bryobacteraceae bacterium]|nr:GNAT family N-acetyltransferase [Bryobacteraceae bacterium]
MEIVPLGANDDPRVVRMLFQEYWDSFGFTPCFQNFASEVAGLPGLYAPPEGRLAIALANGAPAGCVALRRFDTGRCEAKRLYVRERFRGRGIGRELLRWLIAEARAAGYSEMLGDTMPVMAQALAMYERIGFERIAPYTGHPAPGAIHLRLRL